MPKCDLCDDRDAQPDSAICEQCELTLFQLEDIREEYHKNGEAPNEVVSQFLREVRGLYKSNIKTRAYFTAASEVVRYFVETGENELPVRNIRSVAQSSIPTPKILTVLSEARIITREDDVVKPGALTKSILRVQWEQFERDSDRWERRMQEVFGLLVVTLTITLVKIDGDTPRSALAIFHLMSKHVISAKSQNNDRVDEKIPGFRIQGGFSNVTSGAQENIERDLLAFGTDGRPKVVKDIDEEGSWVPKTITIEYMNRVLERWRDRGRDREITLER